MQPIYSKGDTTSCAYALESGAAYIGIAGLEPSLVRGGRSITGCLEYFLAADERNISNRAFDFSVSDAAILKKVSFADLKQMILKYDKGCDCNVFLAQLIELTNRLFITQRAHLDEGDQSYQLRAQLYAQIVTDLLEVWNTTGEVQILAFAKQQSAHEIYQHGEILLRNEMFANFELPQVPMNRFVQEFPPNTVVCTEGDEANGMFVLLRGEIDVMCEGEQVARIRLSGEAFGELSLFLDGKRTATLVTTKETALYRILRRDLPEFHDSHPDLFLNIARTLAQRAQNNISRIEHCRLRIKQLNTSEQDRTRILERRRAGRDDLARLLEDLQKLVQALDTPDLQSIAREYSPTNLKSVLGE